MVSVSPYMNEVIFPTSFLRPAIPNETVHMRRQRHIRMMRPPPESSNIFVWIPYLRKFICDKIRRIYDDFKLIKITCQAACHGKTEHGIFVKFKKPSKTAVVLLAGVTISGTPCPRHFTVPFGAEAPSGHVAQAWAIPPPSWGLLSRWHRQETTTPETNEASSARTQQHS